MRTLKCELALNFLPILFFLSRKSHGLTCTVVFLLAGNYITNCEQAWPQGGHSVFRILANTPMLYLSFCLEVSLTCREASLLSFAVPTEFPRMPEVVWDSCLCRPGAECPRAHFSFCLYSPYLVLLPD